MFTFEQLQIAGMQPSLLQDKINLGADTLRRIFAKIRITENGCWEWTGATQKTYGAIKVKKYRKSVYGVHRICYELVHGEQPRDLDIHHMVEDGCIGPICCNPNHLKPTDRRAHLAELTPSNPAYINAHKTHCQRGHEFTIENTAIVSGGRKCRKCDADDKQATRDAELIRSGKQKYAWSQDKLKTHCKRGHVLSGDNIRMVNQGGREYRRCKLCESINTLKYLGKMGELGIDEQTPPPSPPRDPNESMF